MAHSASMPPEGRSSTGSGEKPCAQSDLAAFSAKGWTPSTPGFEALKRLPVAPGSINSATIDALIAPLPSPVACGSGPDEAAAR
ncbi:MAG: hypothetical protein OXK78_19220 [Caldilineaceae bacterium]|nr:hypothetical protein [Caldilineaceae bacterium]